MWRVDKTIVPTHAIDPELLFTDSLCNPVGAGRATRAWGVAERIVVAWRFAWSATPAIAANRSRSLSGSGNAGFAVRAVVDRWFAPTQRWFKVDADDGNMYVLRHDEASGDWEIAAYRSVAG